MDNLKSRVVKFNNLIFGRVIQKIGLHGLFSKISLPRNSSFLEIGCNDGYSLRIIKEFFAPEILVGVDIDELAIEKAKREIIKSNLDDVKVEVADARILPFKNKKFDGVFMFATLHHISGWQKVIKEAARVLKKGGYFIFKEPLAKFYNLPLAKYFDQPSSLFSEGELKKELKRNNLEISHWNLRGFYKFFLKASIEGVCKKM